MPSASLNPHAAGEKVTAELRLRCITPKPCMIYIQNNK